MGLKTKRLTIIRLLFIILAGVTFFMLPSLLTAIILGEVAMIRAFLIPLITGIVLALSAVLFFRKDAGGIRPRKEYF